MRKLLLLLTLGMSICFSRVTAQQITVNGRVVSATDDIPLPGVSVKIKGTTQATGTGNDGRYSIRVNPGQILTFSFVGLVTQEIRVGSQRSIDVRLQADATTLKEVAVTAFGREQQTKSLGFSTQNVGSREIGESQQPNLVNALQGKAAGVQITNSGGSPGASSNIIIRGGTSLSGNNQPLFVVDGIPVDNTTPVSQGGLAAGVAPASNRAVDLNPEDIASVTVLKGPAAAALYGIRAASGAIVITTKKGSGGSPTVSYNTTFSTDNVNKLPELQSRYKQGERGAFSTTAANSWGPEYATTDLVYDNLGDFFKTGFTQSHDISVSGNTERSTFYASASLFDQGGIVDKTDFARKSARFNADTKVGKKLTVGASANYIQSSRNYFSQGSSNGIMGALFWPRSDNMKEYLDENGNQRVLSTTGNDNPYWTTRNKPITSDVNRILAIGNVVYDPFDFLNITYRLGTDYYTDDFQSVRGAGTIVTGEEKGAIAKAISTNQVTTSTLLATVKKSFADQFNASFTVGHNIEDYRRNTTTSTGVNFYDPTFPSLNNTPTATRTVSNRLERRRIIGLFGDLNLDWKEIIYLNFRGRNDWSSTLPVSDRSFFYPSVSTSIILTDLLKELGSTAENNFVSFAKLRASWARVGKDAPAHVLATTLGTTTNTSTINPRGFITNVNENYGNPALRPEFTNSIEFGADLKFINNRLGLDATYYKTNSDDQILSIRTPPSSASFLAYLNGGRIENEGAEVILNFQALTSTDLKWTIDVNYSMNRSKVSNLPGNIDRVELSDAWVDNNAAQGAAFLNGTMYGINGRVWKRNAEGVLLIGDTGYPQVQSTYQLIGDRNPDWLGGITNTFRYRNASFSFLWDFRVGGDIYNGTQNALVRSGLSSKTLDRGSMVFEGIVESTGQPNARSVELTQDYYQTIYANQGYDFVENGSWARLRYATFAYSLPTSLLAKTPFKTLQLSLTGRNLVLITDYSGVDPEVSGSGAGVGGTGSFGFDNLGVPATRGFDFGLKLTF